MTYVLVTTHRSVITRVVTGPDVDTLKAHVAARLNLPPGARLGWNNYLSHWGLVTADGLTSQTIHLATEV